MWPFCFMPYRYTPTAVQYTVVCTSMLSLSIRTGSSAKQSTAQHSKAQPPLHKAANQRGHQRTGWFKHKTPNPFRVQRPRRFWEIGPENSHTCLMCPCLAFYELIFFSARYLGFCIFAIFGSERITHFQLKTTNKNVKGSAGAQQTRVQISGSIAQKRRGHLDFRAVKRKNHALAS